MATKGSKAEKRCVLHAKISWACYASHSAGGYPEPKEYDYSVIDSDSDDDVDEDPAKHPWKAPVASVYKVLGLIGAERAGGDVSNWMDSMLVVPKEVVIPRLPEHAWMEDQGWEVWVRMETGATAQQVNSSPPCVSKGHQREAVAAIAWVNDAYNSKRCNAAGVGQSASETVGSLAWTMDDISQIETAMAGKTEPPLIKGRNDRTPAASQSKRYWLDFPKSHAVCDGASGASPRSMLAIWVITYQFAAIRRDGARVHLSDIESSFLEIPMVAWTGLFPLCRDPGSVIYQLAQSMKAPGVVETAIFPFMFLFTHQWRKIDGRSTFYIPPRCREMLAPVLRAWVIESVARVRELIGGNSDTVCIDEDGHPSSMMMEMVFKYVGAYIEILAAEAESGSPSPSSGAQLVSSIIPPYASTPSHLRGLMSSFSSIIEMYDNACVYTLVSGSTKFPVISSEIQNSGPVVSKLEAAGERLVEIEAVFPDPCNGQVKAVHTFGCVDELQLCRDLFSNISKSTTITLVECDWIPSATIGILSNLVKEVIEVLNALGNSILITDAPGWGEFVVVCPTPAITTYFRRQVIEHHPTGFLHQRVVRIISVQELVQFADRAEAELREGCWGNSPGKHGYHPEIHLRYVALFRAELFGTDVLSMVLRKLDILCERSTEMSRLFLVGNPFLHKDHRFLSHGCPFKVMMLNREFYSSNPLYKEQIVYDRESLIHGDALLPLPDDSLLAPEQTRKKVSTERETGLDLAMSGDGKRFLVDQDDDVEEEDRDEKDITHLWKNLQTRRANLLNTRFTYSRATQFACWKPDAEWRVPIRPGLPMMFRLSNIRDLENATTPTLDPLDTIKNAICTLVMKYKPTHVPASIGDIQKRSGHVQNFQLFQSGKIPGSVIRTLVGALPLYQGSPGWGVLGVAGFVSVGQWIHLRDTGETFKVLRVSSKYIQDHPLGQDPSLPHTLQVSVGDPTATITVCVPEYSGSIGHHQYCCGAESVACPGDHPDSGEYKKPCFDYTEVTRKGCCMITIRLACHLVVDARCLNIRTYSGPPVDIAVLVAGPDTCRRDLHTLTNLAERNCLVVACKDFDLAKCISSEFIGAVPDTNFHYYAQQLYRNRSDLQDPQSTTGNGKRVVFSGFEEETGAEEEEEKEEEDEEEEDWGEKIEGVETKDQYLDRYCGWNLPTSEANVARNRGASNGEFSEDDEEDEEDGDYDPDASDSDPDGGVAYPQEVDTEDEDDEWNKESRIVFVDDENGQESASGDEGDDSIDEELGGFRSSGGYAISEEEGSGYDDERDDGEEIGVGYIRDHEQQEEEEGDEEEDLEDEEEEDLEDEEEEEEEEEEDEYEEDDEED